MGDVVTHSRSFTGNLTNLGHFLFPISNQCGAPALTEAIESGALYQNGICIARLNQLQKTALRKRDHFPVPDYHMIQYTNVHQQQGRLQSIRYSAVRLTRLGNSRWMVVGKDHGSRIVIQRPLNDLPSMHAGSIDGAVEQFFEFYQPMLIVQIHAGKDFSAVLPELAFEKAASLAGV